MTSCYFFLVLSFAWAAGTILEIIGILNARGAVTEDAEMSPEPVRVNGSL